ncbi:MAG: AHH domain-containing protein [Novosphingobium sp.]
MDGSLRSHSSALQPQRTFLSFRAVNRRDAPGYDPALQRHHLLPRQILGRSCLGPMLDAVGRERLRFDDFRRNGLLLPANDRAAVRIGLPLHRGPHRDYNALVIERVGQIEAGWSATRLRAPEVALVDALHRLELLQRALRRRLLAQQRRLRLNRSDPLGSEFDFSELDAMADLLWPATESPAP